MREGCIVAEGHYSGWGKMHAEQELFKKFVQKLRPTDMLYVNLEPCISFAGKKTPSCAEFLIHRGVKNVVVGMLDPDIRVCGKGLAALRNAGVTIFGPVVQHECYWFNRGYVSLRKKGRPWVTLKRAQTPLGKIQSEHGGRRLMITSETQDRWSHRFLRTTHDAVLVGVQTVIADNPALTVRYGVPAMRQPLRIILDPTLRVPLTAKVCNVECAPTMVITGSLRKDPLVLKKRSELQRCGVEVVDAPLKRNGLFDFDLLFALLTTPREGFFGISSMLVEGGQRTWAAFRKSRIVDMEVTLVGTVQ